MKALKLTADRRSLVLRLIMAEVLARPGEGPLVPRGGSVLGRWRPRPSAQQGKKRT